MAVLRISGPDAFDVAARLTHAPLPPPRRAALRRFHTLDGDAVDRGLLILFPAPGSFTGECIAELHLHGSQGVLRALSQTFGSLPGLRPAGPGEFTRRAFLNGRVDLTQVEALADLISAETALQARLATRQLDGHFGRQVKAWHGCVLEALARTEAMIDFAAEQADVDAALPPALRAELSAAAQDMRSLASGAGAAERLRQGIVVAVIGPPNSGKSSLVNALVRRDVAIVSEMPGTTRDVIEVQLDLEGIPVTVLDTAGLRESDDPVELEGIKRAKARAEAADIRLLLLTADAPMPVDLPKADLLIRSKIDLCRVRMPSTELGVSCRTGEGLAALERAIAAAIRPLLPAEDAGLLVRERHRQLLEEAAQALAAHADSLEGGDLGLACEDLRVAMRALGAIDGRVTVEDLLDRIFSTFCVGK
ncbi:tRNA modification GTPase trmE [Arboricoccus pini]|uniref:tRNA modification GTPase MnmE n=1 Tax=Arboricoccus pini TaxID=1963835 RepID=A0A212R9F9_9PROT|nr:tRNA modification GTPase trmE [Arboricoccus pini]